MKATALPSPALWLLLAFALILAAGCSAAPTSAPQPAPTVTATPTTRPSSTPTPEPTATPTASPTATPSPTPTPTPVPLLRQLTEGGCCTQPFWSPDSSEVWYIDRPDAAAPAAYWSVDAGATLPEPQRQDAAIAYYSPDFSIRQDLGAQTTLVRLADGTSWQAPSGGRPVSFSPGMKRIAWTVSPPNVPVESRVTQVWVANLDGSAARQVAVLPRGGLAGWVSDDVVLLTGAESLQARTTRLLALDLTTNAQTLLAEEQRLRGVTVAPGGQWLAYFITLSPEPEKNGLYLARTNGSDTRKLDPDLFGAFQWRDAGRLTVIPFGPDAAYHALWEVEAATGAARPLTDPAQTPIKIANGDWRTAPDGHAIVFVSATDRNLWVIELPD